MSHAHQPQHTKICARCLAKRPNADELHAALCGDYWGALRSMKRRTGQGWEACIAKLLAAGGAA